MAVTTGDRATTLPPTQAPPAREIERRSIDWVPEDEHWLFSRSLNVRAEEGAIRASDEALEATI